VQLQNIVYYRQDKKLWFRQLNYAEIQVSLEMFIGIDFVIKYEKDDLYHVLCNMLNECLSHVNQ
jgi:hypothetical protein